MGGFVFFGVLLGLLAIAFAIAMLWQRSPRLAIGLALAIPLAVGGLYLLKGRPAALEQKNVERPKTIQDAVAQLQSSLKDEPENFENLVVLARSYMAIEKYDEAGKTYARAMALSSGDAEVGVEYAEAQLRASPNRQFPAAAVVLLENALKQDPDNQRALFFLGLQRMQANKPAEASAFWEQLLPLLQPDAATALRPQVEQARQLAGLPALPDAAFAGIPGLDIEVNIDPTLARLVKPGDVVFVFARNVGGTGPPLAVKRVEAGQWPVKLRLTDADSPMPAGKLSSAKQVEVQARLSKSGNAQGESGDFEADPVTVDTASHAAVPLMITRTRP